MSDNIPVRVAAIVDETPMVKRFTLQSCSGDALPPFCGGSHVVTYLNNGLQRRYSLTSYEKGEYEIAVQLHPQSKGGSHYFHHHVKTGDTLNISSPKNYFQLSHRAKRHVFYAAGIGITPVLSLMKEAEKSAKPFELHYAARSREQCAFYKRLLRDYPEKCTFYFSNEGCRMNSEVLRQHLVGTNVYLCGPDRFITEFTYGASNVGFPSHNVHSERFSPPISHDSTPFTSELSDGRQISVPADRSLLDMLLDAGVKAPHSCRAGRCGTCEVRVSFGIVDHRDEFLSEEERTAQNVILTCVSRAKTPILGIEI
ncbi:PDR/VanB family oxidoreductase [Fictibacillus iocasae]|uniref:PDR/VanB family oxidoreductase n=1 Tax=Fictibacillus iocasae TaxID=2715437 RepID=A0ABW2NSN7_9BACL